MSKDQGHRGQDILWWRPAQLVINAVDVVFVYVQATVVYNLETYGIDPDYFASTVQKGVACSVTVGPRPTKPKEMQVMVQGNQIHYIGQLLRGKHACELF